MDLKIPIPPEVLKKLRPGDAVRLSGAVYVARDAAHARICEIINSGGEPPFPIENSFIYYCGPCPAPPGALIGSCGPTTSSRMDAFAPLLYKMGAAGAIGKGRIGAAVKDAMRRRGAVYFLATGGVGALLARCVASSRPVAFPELGAEAVLRLELRDMPLIVGVDSRGDDIYDIKTRAD